jgi:NAD(P)-dependent dehydrogenase (short-subunit alcohol dehydrogenase family)
MGALEGKVAIVTGASSGIGLAAASKFVAAGARVALFARREEPLAQFVATTNGQAIAISGDVAADGDVERLFAQVEREFGPCDVLINNAGILDPALLIDTSRERWDRMFAVNVTGTFLACRRALPSMIERRGGVIINTASISGVVGSQKFGGFVSYASAKAAIIAFTEALAAEVREHGIRVNAVSPGSVDTRMLKQANPSLIPDMTPDEVAEVILFLATDASRPINGQNVHVYSA